MSIARARSGLLRLAIAGATLGAGMAAAPASTATPANSAMSTGATTPSSAAAIPTTATPPTTTPPTATPPARADCTVSDLLVNPCRPWLGAVVDYYPGPPTWRDQVLAHEQRIGRQVDVVHQYHRSHQVSLTDDERYFAERGTIVYLNWRPADVWADAGGGVPAVDAQIDQFAASIKTLGDTKVILALFGEPERYVSRGTSDCPGLKGSSGSPADYIAMWANVQDRFAAAGAENVVWAINYLGYAGWDCLFPELWPGNDRVDWILWDPYVGPNQTWDDEIGYFYEALEEKSDAAHDYLSKPWGLAEYGYWYGTQDQTDAYRMYDDARAALNTGTYPRLKLYEVYDTVSAGIDVRTSYTATGVFDQVEQDHYNAFANDPLLSDPPPEPPTDHFAGCDTSVESALSCFGGAYAPGARPRRTAIGAHDGTYSVQVKNSTAGAGDFGLRVKPVPVGATEDGRTYTGAVWVRANRVGMPLTLLLRERRGDGSIPPDGETAVTWTATSRGWHFLTGAHLSQESGNTLTYAVYGTNMAPGAWLLADEFSLTSIAPG